jgi:hypothetical protein
VVVQARIQARTHNLDPQAPQDFATDFALTSHTACRAVPIYRVALSIMFVQDHRISYLSSNPDEVVSPAPAKAKPCAAGAAATSSTAGCGVGGEARP